MQHNGSGQMQYVALVLGTVGAAVFLALLLAALCSYYWISEKHYPCAWSATSDVKSDVYYKKHNDWKFSQKGAVQDPEEGVSNDNDEPLLNSLVLDDGASDDLRGRCGKDSAVSGSNDGETDAKDCASGSRKCKTVCVRS